MTSLKKVPSTESLFLHPTRRQWIVNSISARYGREGTTTEIIFCLHDHRTYSVHFVETQYFYNSTVAKAVPPMTTDLQSG